MVELWAQPLGEDRTAIVIYHPAFGKIGGVARIVNVNLSSGNLNPMGTGRIEFLWEWHKNVTSEEDVKNDARFQRLMLEKS